MRRARSKELARSISPFQTMRLAGSMHLEAGSVTDAQLTRLATTESKALAVSILLLTDAKYRLVEQARNTFLAAGPRDGFANQRRDRQNSNVVSPKYVFGRLD